MLLLRTTKFTEPVVIVHLHRTRTMRWYVMYDTRLCSNVDDDKSWLAAYVYARDLHTHIIIYVYVLAVRWRRGVVAVRSEGTACRIQNDVWRHDVAAAAASSSIVNSVAQMMDGRLSYLSPATGGWMFFFLPPPSTGLAGTLYFSLYLI